MVIFFFNMGIVGGTGQADKVEDGLYRVTFIVPPISNGNFVG